MEILSYPAFNYTTIIIEITQQKLPQTSSGTYCNRAMKCMWIEAQITWSSENLMRNVWAYIETLLQILVSLQICWDLKLTFEIFLRIKIWLKSHSSLWLSRRSNWYIIEISDINFLSYMSQTVKWRSFSSAIMEYDLFFILGLLFVISYYCRSTQFWGESLFAIFQIFLIMF